MTRAATYIFSVQPKKTDLFKKKKKRTSNLTLNFFFLWKTRKNKMKKLSDIWRHCFLVVGKSAIGEKSIAGEQWQLVKRIGVMWQEFWNAPLLCLLSLSGKGGLEVCGHGHWQDIPLDVHSGLHTGICWTFSSSLAGWDDLKTSPPQYFYLKVKTKQPNIYFVCSKESSRIEFTSGKTEIQIKIL